MKIPGFRPFEEYEEYPVDEMCRRAAEFAADMRRRRTVRHFSERAVPREIIDDTRRRLGMPARSW